MFLAILDSAEKEQRLIVHAVQSDNNEALLNKLFEHINESSIHFFSDDVKTKIVDQNELNIKRVIKIIKSKGYDKKWDDEYLTADEFKEICAIPILLPTTFIGYLSGEFIIYLLHRDKVRFCYPECISFVPDDTYTLADLKEAERKNIYDIKYHRFYVDETSYVSQLQKAFSVDLSPLLNNDGDLVKRKDTKLWKLCEAYSYLQKGKMFDGNERVKLFQAFSKEYLDIFPMRITGDLNENQKCILLFKTFLLQEIDSQEKRAELSLLTCVKSALVTLNRIANDLRGLLILLNLSTIHADKDCPNPFPQKQDEILTVLHNICQCNIDSMNQALETKEFTSPKRIENHDELCFAILFIIIMYEILRDFEVREGGFNYPFEENTASEEYQPILKMFIPNQTISYEWDKFFSVNHPMLEQLLGKKTEKEYKKLWLMALKILMYCYPERMGINLSEVQSKTLNEAWFKEHNAKLENIRLPELYTIMAVIDKSPNVRAMIVGKNSKKYSSLRISAANTKTFESILNNIRTHKRPELIKQIQYLMEEQQYYFLGEAKVVRCMHDIYTMIKLVIETIIRDSSPPDFKKTKEEVDALLNILERLYATFYHDVMSIYLSYESYDNMMSSIMAVMPPNKIVSDKDRKAQLCQISKLCNDWNAS